MRNQDSLGPALPNLDMCLDCIAAAAHVGRDVGRHVTHAGVKDKTVSRALESGGILRKARTEPVVERQYVVLLRLAPPQFYHIRQAFRFLGSEIIDLGKITIE